MADQEMGKNLPTEKKAEKPVKVKKPSIFSRIGKWFRELKSEVKKIVWPTRQQTIKNTIVVLVAILIIGAFIWVIDAIFSFGITNFITHLA